MTSLSLTMNHGYVQLKIYKKATRIYTLRIALRSCPGDLLVTRKPQDVEFTLLNIYQQAVCYLLGSTKRPVTSLLFYFVRLAELKCPQKK